MNKTLLFLLALIIMGHVFAETIDKKEIYIKKGKFFSKVNHKKITGTITEKLNDGTKKEELIINAGICQKAIYWHKNGKVGVIVKFKDNAPYESYSWHVNGAVAGYIKFANKRIIASAYWDDKGNIQSSPKAPPKKSQVIFKMDNVERK